MFGLHVNRIHAPGKKATLAQHIEAACKAIEAKSEGLTIDAVSFFVLNPRSGADCLDGAQIAELNKYLAKSGVLAIAHSAYVASPWKGSIGLVRKELGICARAGAKGLVVHLPNNQPQEDVVKTLRALLAAPATVPAAPAAEQKAAPAAARIYLETPAVKPKDARYATPEELGALFAAIRRDVDPGLTRVGLCVDTAHLWACGIDLADYDSAAAWFAGLEAQKSIPASAVMLHLNDNIHELASGQDQHARLLSGRIWGGHAAAPATSGLAAVVDYAMRHSTPTILERHEVPDIISDCRNIAHLTDRD